MMQEILGCSPGHERAGAVLDRIAAGSATGGSVALLADLQRSREELCRQLSTLRGHLNQQMCGHL